MTGTIFLLYPFQIFRCDKSQVWETVDRESGQRYCVKILHNNITAQEEIEFLEAAQGSDAVTRLVNVVYEHDSLYIVMEYVPNSNLLTRVVQREGLSEQETKKFMQSLLYGVRHLHLQGICHLDLQPSNILLASDDSVKICDFGSSVRQEPSQAQPPHRGHHRRTSSVSTTSSAGHGSAPDSASPFAAPELSGGRKSLVTSQSDMWSVGVIMHFCLFGCLPPMLESSPSGNTQRRRSSLPPSCAMSSVPSISDTKQISRSAKQLLSGLLHIDPSVRFTAQEALEHSWLQSLYYEVEYKKSPSPKAPPTANRNNREKEKSALRISFGTSSAPPSPRQTTSRRPFLRYFTRRGSHTKNRGLKPSATSDCSTTEATTESVY